jgi:hypothetical protein
MSGATILLPLYAFMAWKGKRFTYIMNYTPTTYLTMGGQKINFAPRWQEVLADRNGS